MNIFANLSGGRDSSAMVVNWLELGNQLDHIIWRDTGYEFPQMYEYIDKLDDYIQRNFNKKIHRIDSSKIIESRAFIEPLGRGNRAGMLRGLPKTLGRDYCTRDTKIHPSRRFVLSISRNQFKNKILIGYTYNEVENGRTSSLDYGMPCYPLHEWGWNEKEITDFLRQRGIMNPLYEKFHRTGCFFCPKQSLASYFMLYKHFPNEWKIMCEWEKRAKELNCVNQQWHLRYSMEQLEEKFQKQIKKESNLFDSVDSDNIDNFDFGETCFCHR